MSPLKFQNYDSTKQEWYSTGKLASDEGVGYVVDHLSGGRQRLFIFECIPDDSCTILYMNECGTGLTKDRILELIERRNELKVFRVLKNGESYETILLPEDGRTVHQVRFLHSKER